MKNKKIAVLTDSSCEIDELTANKLGLYVLRMPIEINDVEYKESVDLSLDDLKAKLKEGYFAKTSQPKMGDIIDMYEKLLKEYDAIVYIPLAQNLSGTYQTASMIASNYDNRIAVVDAEYACYPVTKLCLEAKELIKRGYDDIFEIKRIIEERCELYAMIIPNDINYLKLGGRITPAAASLANLLKIVPILSLKNGIIDLYDKVRTEKKAIQKAIVPVTDVENYADYYWMIIHDDRPEEALALKKQLMEITGQEVTIESFGAVILSHTGPGTLAFGRLRKVIRD